MSGAVARSQPRGVRSIPGPHELPRARRSKGAHPSTNGDRAPASDNATAVIDGDSVLLQDLRVTDPDVVAIAREAEDAEQAIHMILGVGARAIRVAHVSIDTAVVEKAFDGLTVNFDARTEDIAARIEQTAHGLLDAEDGDLVQSLDAFKQGVEAVLDDHFDENSKRGIVAKLERTMEQARVAQIEAIRRVFDPDDELGVLGRYRTDIVKAIKDETSEVRKAVNEVSEKIAVRTAETSLVDKMASKGATFEELIHAHVAGLVSSLGDTAERVGRVRGSDGNQLGDELVTLNTEDTGGSPARYVLELKDRKLGMNAILDELDASRSNRDALAAVAVFSRPEHAPSGSPFMYSGNRAIVVLDKDDPDDAALRLALMWARWVVRRELTVEESELDASAISGLIDDASRSLDRLTTIRRCHSTAKKKIDEASVQCADLVAEVDVVLNAVRKEIGQ